MLKKSIKQVLDDMLARREYSVAEAKRVLLSKGFLDASIENIVAVYTERGFISNERYREEKIFSLMRKGYGPIYVKHQLALRGVSFQKDGYNWSEAYQVAKRKAGKREGLALKQYLYRRGFTHEQN